MSLSIMWYHCFYNPILFLIWMCCFLYFLESFILSDHFSEIVNNEICSTHYIFFISAQTYFFFPDILASLQNSLITHAKIPLVQMSNLTSNLAECCAFVDISFSIKENLQILKYIQKSVLRMITRQEAKKMKNKRKKNIFIHWLFLILSEFVAMMTGNLFKMSWGNTSDFNLGDTVHNSVYAPAQEDCYF